MKRKPDHQLIISPFINELGFYTHIILSLTEKFFRNRSKSVGGRKAPLKQVLCIGN